MSADGPSSGGPCQNVLECPAEIGHSSYVNIGPSIPGLLGAPANAACLLAFLGTIARIPAAPPPPPAPPSLPRAQVMSAIQRARAGAPVPTDAARPLTVVLLAHTKDHGPGAHDYPLWQKRWTLLLGGAGASGEPATNLHGPDVRDPDAARGASGVRVECAWGWPTTAQWEGADVVAAFCYLKWDQDRIAQVRRHLERGRGLVLIHSATWVKPAPSPEVAGLVGVGGFRKYRHGAVTLDLLSPEHPILAGLPSRIVLEDETYWPPTPLDRAGVRVLATGLERPADASDVGEPEPQPMIWTREQGRGRVFGFVPGHWSWTFDHPYVRLLLVRAIAWAAGEDARRFDNVGLRGAAIEPPLP